MKTTVEISDPLFREAKRYAAKHDLTFREVVEAGLRQAISPVTKPKKPFKLKDASFKGGGGMLRAFTWDEIMELSDRGSVE